MFVFLLSIPFLYLLIKELGGSNITGLISASLFSVAPFFHFYAQSKGQVSLGGAFGLGISIGGETAGLQTYFFGPSVIMGKGQRIVFSTGLMGGKVDRLAQGYQVGDAYDEVIVPTKSIYELGYFLGVSFNLIGN